MTETGLVSHCLADCGSLEECECIIKDIVF